MKPQHLVPTDIPTLVKDMRDLMDKVKFVELAGQLVRDIEVGPTSFVQIVEARPVSERENSFAWHYQQLFVDKMGKDVQDRLIGSYLNEIVGRCKIVGIFNVIK